MTLPFFDVSLLHDAVIGQLEIGRGQAGLASSAVSVTRTSTRTGGGGSSITLTLRVRDRIRYARGLAARVLFW